MPRLERSAIFQPLALWRSKGAWIDEYIGAPRFRPFGGAGRAEDGWLALGAAIGVPVAVLRLAGIYGRDAMRSAISIGDRAALVKKDQPSRIRVEDGAVPSSADRGLGGLYNVTDDGPPAAGSLRNKAMGVEAPPERSLQTANSAHGTLSRGEQARLQRATSPLGFAFFYPQYRMSLADLWSSGRWRA